MDVPFSLTTKSFVEVENFVQSYNKRLHLQKETFFTRLSARCTASHLHQFSLQFFLTLGQAVF